MKDPIDDAELEVWFGQLLARDAARAGLADGPARTLRYGAAEQQVVDLWLPRAPIPPAGLVVSIHGGYFMPQYHRGLHVPIVHELVAQGFAVANVEYRVAGQGGGVSETTADVRDALDLLDHHLPGVPTAVLGHSAGGYLAERTANHPRVELVVPLAPLTDLAVQSRLSEVDAGLLAAWTGATAGDAPALYESAHPRSAWPTACPHVVMHGRHDTTVPVEQSVAYVSDAVDAGEDVTFVELPDDGHFAFLDPREPAFATVLSLLHDWRSRLGDMTDPCTPTEKHDEGEP